jgi:hypothetical protein
MPQSFATSLPAKCVSVPGDECRRTADGPLTSYLTPGAYRLGSIIHEPDARVIWVN